MSTSRSPSPDLDTRRRLLEAASAVFAEHGYRAATVRDICRRAGANVAAVNYHFGGKEELYGELFVHLGRSAVERHPPDMGVAADASAHDRLFAFVHSFLLRILSDDGFGRHGCLVAREMMAPTSALDRLVDETIRPLFTRLRGIVGEILGDAATPDRIVLSTRSIVGQCLFYHHARPVIERLTPGDALTPARIRVIAEHVTRFSLEGLQQLTSSESVTRAGSASASIRRAARTTRGTPRAARASADASAHARTRSKASNVKRKRS